MVHPVQKSSFGAYTGKNQQLSTSFQTVIIGLRVTSFVPTKQLTLQSLHPPGGLPMASVPIQLMSDLHLEIERGIEIDYGNFDIPALAPTLALLGDIGVVEDARLFLFLRKLLGKFETILYVLGNHESYRATYVSAEQHHSCLLSSSRDLPIQMQTLTIERLENFEIDIARERSEGTNLGQFIFLNRKAWSPSSSPDLVVLGCTLWTQLNPGDLDILTWSMTDFKQIEGMTSELYDELHVRDCRWLEGELKRLALEPDKKVAVLTHHAPIVEGASDPKFSDPNNPTSSGFVTDMLTPATGVDFAGKPRERGVLLGPPVHTWAFGHTHWCCDFSLKGEHSIHLVSNQKGYKSGMQDCALSFNREFVLEL
jgi:hypothetical protein